MTLSFLAGGRKREECRYITTSSFASVPMHPCQFLFLVLKNNSTPKNQALQGHEIVNYSVGIDYV
jgi:hypothetical protein